MSSYEFWKFLHVLAAMVWIGGAVIIQVYGILTKRAADPVKSATNAQNVSFVVMRVIFPSALVVLGAGFGLVESVGYGYDEPFILWGLILWVVVATLAFGYLGGQIGAAGRKLAADGPSPELALRMRNLVYLSRALLAVLVVIVFLMVVKPGT